MLSGIRAAGATYEKMQSVFVLNAENMELVDTVKFADLVRILKDVQQGVGHITVGQITATQRPCFASTHGEMLQTLRNQYLKFFGTAQLPI